MVDPSPMGVKACDAVRSRPAGQMEQAPLRALERPAIGGRDEDRVVARDRADDLRPARAIEGRRDRMRGARQRAQHQQEPGLVDLEREVGEQLAQAVLAGGLGLDEARRQGVGRRSPRGRP